MLVNQGNVSNLLILLMRKHVKKHKSPKIY